MPNIKSIITSHNKHILKKEQHQKSKTCNCLNKENCPPNNNCLLSNIIYEATLKSDHTEKKYIGISETTFKKRYANHKQSFNTEKYKNSTTLSTEYWKIKKSGHKPTVSWKILRKTTSHNPETNKCLLCMYEKYYIATSTHPGLLNKRNEIISKCRHQKKFLLKQIDSND